MYRSFLTRLKPYSIKTALLISAVCSMSSNSIADVIPLTMTKGAIADYGATPWYTTDIELGVSPMKFALDTGANFIWATSDLCSTPACKAHDNVDTKQIFFKWIDRNQTPRSFGPWGTMITETGQVPFNISSSTSVISDFFASISYEGPKFEYLTWGGGIGFPSRSDQVASGSSFFFEELWQRGQLSAPEFSSFTDKVLGGVLYLGGEDPNLYKASSEIVLEPKKGSIAYLWGTELHGVSLNNTALLELSDITFFLDSGSSRFKGDGAYIYPILKQLILAKDGQGNLIFEKIMEQDTTTGELVWVGLSYKNGGPNDYSGYLPNLSLDIGQSCSGDNTKGARITLSPTQYSYLVEEGERSGKWVIAAHRLDGVGGLLVGSTFLDLMYSKFRYNVSNHTGELVQGDMSLYQKTNGEGPSSISCIPIK